MSKTWKIKEENLALQNTLSSALAINPLIAQLLINRNIIDIDQAKQFLSADISDLYDPFLLKNMDVAVNRIEKAHEKNEKILIFGDYDVDGITSSVLLTQALQRRGIETVNYIPHRMKDGYGLNANITDFAQENNVHLIITVDCGITAIEEVDIINKAGIEIIIIDHHMPAEEGLPNAFTIINPKQKDCLYPFKFLAAVGLVVKLIHALEGEIHKNILDFAAIGTIADIVPLHGENRILVKQGLPLIAATTNHGLAALLDITKIKGKEIKPYHIGFVIGPRINAAGRMESALASLDLFLSKDSSYAQGLAYELDAHNKERQRMQRSLVQEAFDMIETNNSHEQKIIVIGKEGWHKGIIGIVASRIKDKYSRPTIVIAIKNGVGTASARSVNGFHLHEALSQCAEHLEEFGGHAGAAGLTIKEENIEKFNQKINEVADKTLDNKKLDPVLSIDSDVLLSCITLDLAQKTAALEPFGEGNPEPIFCSNQVRVNSIPQILGKNTLKFWVSDGNQTTISAVGFGMGDFKEKLQKGQLINIAYHIGIDDWNKAPVPQLMLKDIKKS